jgi:hypothetical protein
MLDDIFIIKDTTYILACIKPLPKNQYESDEDYVVILKDVNTKKNKKISIKKFITMLHDNNTTYEYARSFNKMQQLLIEYHMNVNTVNIEDVD